MAGSGHRAGAVAALLNRALVSAAAGEPAPCAGAAAGGAAFRCGEAAAARPAPAPARRARTAMALDRLPPRGTAPLLSGAEAQGWGAWAMLPVGGR